MIKIIIIIIKWDKVNGQMNGQVECYSCIIRFKEDPSIMSTAHHFVRGPLRRSIVAQMMANETLVRTQAKY